MGNSFAAATVEAATSSPTQAEVSIYMNPAKLSVTPYTTSY
jgi:hypothetical protein